MKVGDKVAHVSEDLKGKIIKISGETIVLEDEHGFGYTVEASLLVPDASYLYDSLEIPCEFSKKEVSKNKTKKNTQVLDLHFDQLVKDPKNYESYERLLLQKQVLLERIEYCKRVKSEKLLIIHGHGDGVLQNFVISILEEQGGIEYRHTELLKEESASILVYFR